MERAHRTHTEEFYEVADFPLDMAGLNQALRAWEHTYNTIRPHQALGYLTPQQYLLKCKKGKGGCVTNVLNEYKTWRGIDRDGIMLKADASASIAFGSPTKREEGVR